MEDTLLPKIKPYKEWLHEHQIKENIRLHGLGVIWYIEIGKVDIYWEDQYFV